MCSFPLALHSCWLLVGMICVLHWRVEVPLIRRSLPSPPSITNRLMVSHPLTSPRHCIESVTCTQPLKRPAVHQEVRDLQWTGELGCVTVSRCSLSSSAMAQCGVAGCMFFFARLFTVQGLLLLSLAGR